LALRGFFNMRFFRHVTILHGLPSRCEKHSGPELPVSGRKARRQGFSGNEGRGCQSAASHGRWQRRI
jgi:hypothetical protein